MTAKPKTNTKTLCCACEKQPTKTQFLPMGYEEVERCIICANADGIDTKRTLNGRKVLKRCGKVSKLTSEDVGLPWHHHVLSQFFRSP